MKVVKKEKPKKPQKKSGIGKTILSTLALIFAFIASISIIIGFASPKRLSSSGEISQLYTTVDSSGGTYFGSVNNMAYNGVGEFHYLSGGIYEGSFEDSSRSGEGTFVWDDGDSFSGTWAGDNMVAGTYTWANGDSYSGEWSDNDMTTGTYLFADGTSYTGSFDAGMFGSGTLTLDVSAEDSPYTSYAVVYDNRAVSSVTIKAKDGKAYVGALTGQAKITYSNGDTYEGAVKDCLRHGTGTYIWHDSDGKVAAKYEGAWTDGVMGGGQGTYYYSEATYPHLQGPFYNGKPNGTVVYYKEAGNTFDTTWSNGKCTKVVET